MTHDERVQRVAEAMDKAPGNRGHNFRATDVLATNEVEALAEAAIAASDATLEFSEQTKNALAIELNQWGIVKYKTPLLIKRIVDIIKNSMGERTE